MQTNEIPAEDWITSTVAAARIGATPRMLRKLEVKGDGPPVYRFTPRMVRYRRSEVDAWIKSRASHSAARPQEQTDE